MHHVTVRKNEAIWSEDETRAAALSFLRRSWSVSCSTPNRLLDFDIHHRWADLFRCRDDSARIRIHDVVAWFRMNQMICCCLCFLRLKPFVAEEFNFSSHIHLPRQHLIEYRQRYFHHIFECLAVRCSFCHQGQTLKVAKEKSRHRARIADSLDFTLLLSPQQRTIKGLFDRSRVAAGPDGSLSATSS